MKVSDEFQILGPQTSKARFPTESVSARQELHSLVVEELIYPTPLIDFFRRSLYIAFP